MGWTGTHANFYKKKGGRMVVDVKAECDDLFAHDHGRFKVLKSTVLGRVYYAAVAICKKWPEGSSYKPEELVEIPENERRVVGFVILTSVDNNDWFNFNFKEMEETCGPCEDHCPMGIIKLLTPTISEYANEWRERCRKYAESKKTANNPSKLPIGTRIRFKAPNGEYITLEKRSPAYQFKTPWWYDASNHTYCSKKRLPKEFEILV